MRNLDGCDGLRMILKYADARKHGLTRMEAEQLLLDKAAHESASLTLKEEINDDRTTDDE